MNDEQTPELSLRESIAREILETEYNFIQKIKCLSKYFIQPFLDIEATIGKHSGKICNPSLAIFLQSTQKIIPVHEKFYKILDDSLATWDDSSSKLSHIFFAFADELRSSHKTYIERYDECEVRMKQLYDSKESLKGDFVFRVFADKATDDISKNLVLYKNAKIGFAPLSSYFGEVYQRTVRYRLLLQTMLKHTPSNHPDYEGLDNAVSKIDIVASILEEDMNIRGNYNTLSYLSVLLNDPSFSQRHKQTKVRPCLKCTCTILSEENKNGSVIDECEVWLIGEMIILVDKKKKSLIEKHPIAFAKCDIKSNSSSALILSIDPYLYLLDFGNQSSRDNHFDTIQSSIDDLRVEDSEEKSFSSRNSMTTASISEVIDDAQTLRVKKLDLGKQLISDTKIFLEISNGVLEMFVDFKDPTEKVQLDQFYCSGIEESPSHILASIKSLIPEFDVSPDVFLLYNSSIIYVFYSSRKSKQRWMKNICLHTCNMGIPMPKVDPDIPASLTNSSVKKSQCIICEKRFTFLSKMTKRMCKTCNELVCSQSSCSEKSERTDNKRKCRNCILKAKKEYTNGYLQRYKSHKKLQLDRGKVDLSSVTYWRPFRDAGCHWTYSREIEIDPSRDIIISYDTTKSLRKCLTTYLSKSENDFVDSFKRVVHFYVSPLLAFVNEQNETIVKSSMHQFCFVCEGLLKSHISVATSLYLGIQELEMDDKSLEFVYSLDKIVHCFSDWKDFIRLRVCALEASQSESFIEYVRERRAESENAPDFHDMFDLPAKRFQYYLPVINELLKHTINQAEQEAVDRIAQKLIGVLKELSVLTRLTVMESRFAEFGFRTLLTSPENKFILEEDLICIRPSFAKKQYTYYFLQKSILETSAYRVLREISINSECKAPTISSPHQISIQYGPHAHSVVTWECASKSQYRIVLNALKEMGLYC